MWKMYPFDDAIMKLTCPGQVINPHNKQLTVDISQDVMPQGIGVTLYNTQHML